MTIKDIAKICNVSRQTVSRVLNNSLNVKKETREKILKVIKEFNYKPNTYAQNLSGNKTRINILISVRSNLKAAASIWMNRLINNIISINKNKNIKFIIEQSYDKDDFNSSLISTTSGFIDGVIIFYEEKNDKRVEALKKSNIPYIIYGNSYNNDDVCIKLDTDDFMDKVVKYCISKNLKEIIFFSAKTTPVNIARVESLKKAFRKYKLDLSYLKIIDNINTQRQVYEHTVDLIENNKLPDLLFVSGDEKAIGALNALNKYKVKIPDKVSILGIDNIPISEYFTPSLSTINFNYIDIATVILKTLLKMIEGDKEESKLFNGTLVFRESTK